MGFDTDQTGLEAGAGAELDNCGKPSTDTRSITVREGTGNTFYLHKLTFVYMLFILEYPFQQYLCKMEVLKC